MSSTEKTPNLQLNKWSGADKPKRLDFNSDNEIIDSLLGGHINDGDIHVTATDKAFWNSMVVTGWYTGNGEDSKSVTLNFKPSCVIVFQSLRPPVIYSSTDGKNNIYCAMATDFYNSVGVEISNVGFTVAGVFPTELTLEAPCVLHLNDRNKHYSYVAFK